MAVLGTAEATAFLPAVTLGRGAAIVAFGLISYVGTILSVKVGEFADLAIRHLDQAFGTISEGLVRVVGSFTSAFEVGAQVIVGLISDMGALGQIAAYAIAVIVLGGAVVLGFARVFASKNQEHDRGTRGLAISHEGQVKEQLSQRVLEFKQLLADSRPRGGNGKPPKPTVTCARCLQKDPTGGLKACSGCGKGFCFMCQDVHPVECKPAKLKNAGTGGSESSASTASKISSGQLLPPTAPSSLEIPPGRDLVRGDSGEICAAKVGLSLIHI